MESKKVELIDHTSLYKPVPEILGGRNSRPLAAAIGNLLPYPKGTTAPLEQQLNNTIRHKILFLDGKSIPGNAPKTVLPSDALNALESDESPKTEKEIILKRRGSKRGRPNGNKLVLPQDEQKYSIYEPLHDLWKQYASELSRDNPSKVPMRTPRSVNTEVFADRVIRMDLHGALIKVVRSKDPTLVGKTGIVVAETANTLLIVTKEDRALTLPKNVCVIEIQVDDYRVEVYMPALAFRSSERSARKMKKKHMPYI